VNAAAAAADQRNITLMFVAFSAWRSAARDDADAFQK